jgi:hypothetical protein
VCFGRIRCGRRIPKNYRGKRISIRVCECEICMSKSKARLLPRPPVHEISMQIPDSNVGIQMQTQNQETYCQQMIANCATFLNIRICGCIFTVAFLRGHSRPEPPGNFCNPSYPGTSSRPQESISNAHCIFIRVLISGETFANLNFQSCREIRVCTLESPSAESMLRLRNQECVCRARATLESQRILLIFRRF